MNEILALIYYVYNKDDNQNFTENAEADAFYTFSAIMTEIQDGFLKQMDCDP